MFKRPGIFLDTKERRYSGIWTCWSHQLWLMNLPIWYHFWMWLKPGSKGIYLELPQTMSGFW